MGTEQKRKAGWKRWTLRIFVGIAFLYLLCGFVLVPLAVWFAAPRVAGGIIEGSLELGAVRMNPLTFTVTVREALLRDPDGEVALSIDRFHANADPVGSLFRRELSASELSLAGLRLNVLIEENGELNLVRATALRDPPPPPDEPAEPFEIPAAFLGRFALEDAEIHFEDRSGSAPFQYTITSLNVLLEDIRTSVEHGNTYEIVATGESDERVTVEGEFQLNPLSFWGQVNVDGFRAPVYAPLYAELLPVHLADGRFRGSLEYRFDPLAETPRLGIADGSFEIDSVELRPGEDEPAFFGLDRLAVTGIAADLFEQRASVGSVEIGPGFLKVVREADGSIDLLALLPAPAPDYALVETDPAVPAERSPIEFGVLSGGQDLGKPVDAALSRVGELTDADWIFELTSFDFSGFVVELEDRTGPEPVLLRAHDIALGISNLTNAPEEAADVQFSLSLNDAGSVGVNGSVVPNPATADLAFELTGLDLAPFAPLAEGFVPLRLDSAVVEVSGDARAGLGPEGDPFADVRTSVAVRDFSIRLSGDEHALAAFRELTITDVKAAMEPLSVDVAEIRMVGPRARVERLQDGSLAVLRLVPEGVPADEALAVEDTSPPLDDLGPLPEVEAAPPAIPPLPVRLGRFVLEDGDIEFLDASVQPAGRIELKPFQILIEDISLEEGTETKAEFSGTLAEAGTIEWNASTGLADFRERTRLEMAIREIPLAVFSPYAIDGVGRPIDSGSFSGDFNIAIDANDLDATNQLRVQSLRFGRGDSAMGGPPVGVAVAALENRNSLITLDVPISGSLDDPDFHPAQLFARILRTTATRALTAPLSIAGSLVGGTLSGISVLRSAEEDDGGFDHIAFTEGSFELDGEGREILETLRSFLAERPQAQLVVIPAVNPEADFQAMVRAELDGRLAATGASSRSGAVRQLYEETFGDPQPADNTVDTLPDTIEDTVVDPEETEETHARRTVRMAGFYLSGPVRRGRVEAAPPESEEIESEDFEPEEIESEPATSVLSVAEMERRLLDEIELDEGSLDDLANARFETVREFITASGDVSSEQVSATPHEEGEPGARFAFDTDLE